jgi:hypothetical protein
MRDGVMSVAKPGAHSSTSLLCALKQEFGFYCIELCVEPELTQSEVAFVMSGRKISGTLSGMEQYDVSSGQWSAVATMSTARHSFGACVLAGELYVTGGFNTDDVVLSSVEKYSPLSDKWSAVVPLPKGRGNHDTVAVGSAMYVLGGVLRNGGRIIASTLKFDTTQGTWSEVAPMPEAREHFASCAMGSDIYIFGGHDDDHIDEEPQDAVFKYDTETNTWSTLAPMPSSCAGNNASVLDGLIYVAGFGDNVDEVRSFDPVTDAWSTLAPTLPNSRGIFGRTFVLDSCLCALGGMGDVNGQPMSWGNAIRRDQ